MRGYLRSFTQHAGPTVWLRLAARMIKSTLWADKLALPAFQDRSAVDTVLPVMDSIVRLGFGVLTLGVVGWFVRFHSLKLVKSSGGVKQLKRCALMPRES